MVNFLKKQILKIIIYIVVLTLVTTLWFFSKWDIFILIALVSFITSVFTLIIGKTWMEDYKLEIDKELEKYKVRLSGYTLVTKLQYDLEFKIYTKIYEVMFLLYIKTDKLHPIIDNLPTEKEAFKTEIRNRLNHFGKLYNKASNLINKYRPFYSDKIFEILKETRDLCHKESIEVSLIVTSHSKPFDYIKSMDRKEKIRINLETTSNLIKNRIENMKIIE
jgi:hypothetical protein